MKMIKKTNEDRVIQDFLYGTSAEAICRYNKIKPMELVELLKSTQLVFPNELFDLPLDDEKNAFSDLKSENIELKKEQEKLMRKVKEHEIEIRIHKELLNTFLIKN